MDILGTMVIYLNKKRLFVPKSSIRELLVKKAHEGGLMGHFGVPKTLEYFCNNIFIGLI